MSLFSSKANTFSLDSNRIPFLLFLHNYLHSPTSSLSPSQSTYAPVSTNLKSTFLTVYPFFIYSPLFMKKCLHLLSPLHHTPYTLSPFSFLSSPFSNLSLTVIKNPMLLKLTDYHKFSGWNDRNSFSSSSEGRSPKWVLQDGNQNVISPSSFQGL